MPRSISNSTSMRLTASSAIGEIAAGSCCAGHWRQYPPTQRTAALRAPSTARRNRPRQTGVLVKLVVAVIGIGLQNAGEVPQMPDRMFMPPVSRGVIQRRRMVPVPQTAGRLGYRSRCVL